MPQAAMDRQDTMALGDFSLEAQVEMAGGKPHQPQEVRGVVHKSALVAAVAADRARRRVNFTKGEMDFQA